MAIRSQGPLFNLRLAGGDGGPGVAMVVPESHRVVAYNEVKRSDVVSTRGQTIILHG